MMWDEDEFRCRVSEDIVAGFYDLTLHRTTGLSTISPSVYTYNRRGKRHILESFGQIDSVSPSSGSAGGGTTLTIRGSGFSPGLLDNTILADSLPCRYDIALNVISFFFF